MVPPSDYDLTSRKLAAQYPWEGPQIWAEGYIHLGIQEEPRPLTLEMLEVVKHGPTSYAGCYACVWAGAESDGVYTALPGKLPDELSALLFVRELPMTILQLRFHEARYIPTSESTTVELGVRLSRKAHWNNGSWHEDIERRGAVRCTGDVGSEWEVEWEEQTGHRPKGEQGAGVAAGPRPRLGFSLEPDHSPLKSPFACMTWTHGMVTVRLLFKKIHDPNEVPRLTRGEAVRLGIGMIPQDMEAAYNLSMLRFAPVILGNELRRLDESKPRGVMQRRPIGDAKEA